MNLDYKRIQAIESIPSHDEKMIAAAVMYTEQGFYVIPVRPNDKAIPEKRTGLTYLSSSNKPDIARKWWDGKYKGWNIGLSCGAKDGIFVLDVDNGKDKNGFPALHQMIEDHGELITLKQRTPSGGIHYVFEWFECGRSSTSKIAKGIDTRGGSGSCSSHIVAWPSTINGKPYQWEDVRAVIQAPPWLADLMGVPWEHGSNIGQGGNRGNENVDDNALEQHFLPREIWAMLGCINVDALEYEEWLQIGQAIHSQHPDDVGIKLWDRWSQTGERYESNECEKRWNGFKAYGPIRVGTLIYFAKVGGYRIKPNVSEIEFGGEKSDYEALIDEMNKEWGIAVVGGKIRVIGAGINADPEQDLQLLTLDDFKNLTMNQQIAMTNGTGQTKPVPKSAIWLADEGRKEFRGGIHFRPDQEDEFKSKSGLVYNMWRGWTSEPAKGDWSKLKDHICQILCAGDEELSTWMLDWMADLYQDPANPKGCALVMKGIEGCGKGTLLHAMGQTMGRHYKHVTQEEHMTGRFNGHLQDALLVFADEVIYGGSKKTAGNLKAMVTESKLTVERKGIDAYSFKNCARIGIASNEDWFIPAGPQSRRWFVLDVLPDKASDGSWFGPLNNQLSNGGTEGMMFELLERKITSNLMVAPVTALLEEQRARFAESRHNSMSSWWYDCLEAQEISVMCYMTENMEDMSWPIMVSKPDLYNNYMEWARTAKMTEQPTSKALFYKRIFEFGITEVRPSSDIIIKRNGGKRLRMFEIPNLASAVAIYTKNTGKQL